MTITPKLSPTQKWLRDLLEAQLSGTFGPRRIGVFANPSHPDVVVLDLNADDQTVPVVWVYRRRQEVSAFRKFCWAMSGAVILAILQAVLHG